MNHQQTDDRTDGEAIEEQLQELRRLGVQDADLQGLSYADAEAWIDELREARAGAGRTRSWRRRTTR